MTSNQHLLVHYWSDGCAVFDRKTGNTHAMNTLACSAIEVAQNGGDARQAVRLAAYAGQPDATASELEQIISNCVQQLERCGLITPETIN